MQLGHGLVPFESFLDRSLQSSTPPYPPAKPNDRGGHRVCPCSNTTVESGDDVESIEFVFDRHVRRTAFEDEAEESDRYVYLRCRVCVCCPFRLHQEGQCRSLSESQRGCHHHFSQYCVVYSINSRIACVRMHFLSSSIRLRQPLSTVPKATRIQKVNVLNASLPLSSPSCASSARYVYLISMSAYISARHDGMTHLDQAHGIRQDLNLDPNLRDIAFPLHSMILFLPITTPQST